MFGVSLHRQDRTLYVNKILTKKTGSRHSLVEKSLNIVEGFFCEIYMMLNLSRFTPPPYQTYPFY